MNREEMLSKVVAVLSRIAPEADPAQLRPDISLRSQLDIDSMDQLNFMIGLHKEFQVEIPERDYPKLTTLNGCVEYLLHTAHA
ncbi:MAG TPA: phosphopantetheine-binding protein [Planctomycetaceae bacterium]|nr:phosphopantetheine-binding protein [Planctomycetaceae bacterium]